MNWTGEYIYYGKQTSKIIIKDNGMEISLYDVYADTIRDSRNDELCRDDFVDGLEKITNAGRLVKNLDPIKSVKVLMF